jgi:hypothetical protein
VFIFRILLLTSQNKMEKLDVPMTRGYGIDAIDAVRKPSLTSTPDTEAPLRRAPEVHSALGLAGDARRHTDPLPVAPREWNGNDNDWAFLVVGVPA